MRMRCILKWWMRQAHHWILHQKKQVSIKSLSYNTMRSYSPLQVHTHLVSNFTLFLVTTTHVFNRLYTSLINQFVPGKISQQSYVLTCPTIVLLKRLFIHVADWQVSLHWQRQRQVSVICMEQSCMSVCSYVYELLSFVIYDKISVAPLFVWTACNVSYYC